VIIKEYLDTEFIQGMQKKINQKLEWNMIKPQAWLLLIIIIIIIVIIIIPG
jgi:hypothetical protein